MLFDPTNAHNRFGYFTVGDTFKTYSQFEAQEHAGKIGGDVEWHFNDEFFSSIDWTVEPTQSLKELYAERAMQIRNRYDYLVLYFSGGSDSHNILSTFYEYDIHLDEILTHHTYTGEKDKFSAAGNMSEITLAAIPEAKRFVAKYPRTIHRLVDVSDLLQKFWAQNLHDLKFNFLYYSNFYPTPHHLVVSELGSILPEYQHIIDSGKRVCFIHGNDKPNIRLHDGQWQFCFRSNAIDSSGFSIRRQFEPAPYEDILFYWDPDAWKIIIKQSHVLKNYLYNNHSIIKHAMQGKFSDIPAAQRSFLYINGEAIPSPIIKDAIYPYWRNDIVDLGKPAWNLYGPKNIWWTKSNLPGAKEHVAGIDYLVKKIGATCNGPLQKVYLSKPYCFSHAKVKRSPAISNDV